MWKICKILKSVKNAPSLYNCAKSNAVCSSENDKDEEDEKHHLGDKIIPFMPQRISLTTNEQLFNNLNKDGALFINYFSGVRILSIGEQNSNDCHLESNDVVQSKLPTREISTQTETESSQVRPKSENLFQCDEAKNFDVGTNELLGSFKNVVGLSLIRKSLYSEAYEHFRQAANIYKHPGAMYNLGLCFYKGYGVNKDRTQAMQLWIKAAEQGHSKAQYQVAVGYIRGIGNLPKDKNLALKYLDRSRKSENPPSEVNKRDFYVTKIFKCSGVNFADLPVEFISSVYQNMSLIKNPIVHLP